ncbi:DUF881 domain-containing protein [Clostridium gasigenes]|uniref:DUF881 domain-containing protein n=1 Tax=Clostridium gasigenes TaxID=94869 RepID=UPI001C0E0907|nr:DUF881 domain-containing protein [Clostridium gasigenes]
MKNISGKIVAFIATLIIGFIIAINIKLNKSPAIKQLSAKEYKDTIDERNKLFKDLETLRTENDYSKDKINSYTHDDKKQEKLVKDMLAQVNDYGMITGLLPVKGQGIVIKIEENSYKISRDIFHNIDAAMVLNEIRTAGGEAVALNNHRIIPTTSIICDGAFLEFDNNATENSPFYYYVIGNPEQLKLKLTEEGSYINKLIDRKLKVEIEVKEEIIIPSSTQSFDPNFMKENKIK